MSLIVKPIITEKANALTEDLGRYSFEVHKNANKVEIKKVIEQTYGVTVEAVNTMRYAGKMISRNTKTGVTKGRRAAFKKAIVTLKDGDTIDFYSNI